MRIRLVLAIVALFAMICAGAYADVTSGLVSAWHFDDGTAADIKARNDGIIHGATPAAGKFGNALSFDGVDDYVEIPDSASLHLPEGLTVAAWMNVNVGNNHAAISWKGVMVGWGANFGWRVCTTTNTDMTWGRCAEGVEGWFATAGVIPATGEWVHVAMTALAPDAPTNLTAYVNGEDITGVSAETGMGTAPPYLLFEGEPVEIGVGRGIDGVEGNDVYFDGLIDEVVIYNRGLTRSDILELMDTDLTAAVHPAGKLASVWGEIKSGD